MAEPTIPDLTITPPDVTFWRAAATEARRSIRVRTESKGQDHQERRFIGYGAKYAEYRQKKGRSSWPNLSFSGRMVGSMQTTAKNLTGKISLSGEEANKALGNEERGRIFFGLSKSDIDAVLKTVDAWMTRKNRLK